MKLDLDVAADTEGIFKDLVNSLEGVKVLAHTEEGPAGGNPCTETYYEFIRLHSV